MKKMLIVLLTGVLLLVACSAPLPESVSEVRSTLEAAAQEVAEAVEEHSSAETHAVHWSYEGEGAPEKWGDLGYAECTGTTQSPIDLTNAATADLENIRFDYGETAVKILNNGHTIQVDKIEGSQIVIGGETYFLKQFHFHAPSEHTLNGEHFPIEMHLVHKTADGSKAAVVGVFIAEGAENDAFAPVWAHLPGEETAYELNENGEKVYIPQDTGAVVSLGGLLPAEQLIYRYDGSLTTPPCSPNILWSVMQTPIAMSAGQIAEFTWIMEGNNRPLQGLNERDLQLDITP
jgi:carbonic anhydrase